MVYVLFGERVEVKNSKNLGNCDSFNTRNQRREGSFRKAWTMKNYLLGFKSVDFKFTDTGPLENMVYAKAGYSHPVYLMFMLICSLIMC